MANEKVTELPTVVAATTADIIYAVQGGTSVQETLQQVLNLTQANIILNYAGNPNGNVAGVVYTFCYDTTNSKLYICTTSGSTSTAVWTLIGALVVAPVQGGTGVSNPTAHTLPIANGSSAFTFQALTNGQLLIGSTGAAPVAANLVAGTNMTITNNAGSITLSSTGGGVGFVWNNATSATQLMDVGNGYYVNHAGGITFTLPTPPSSFADTVQIIGFDTGWTIAQGAGQSIIDNDIQTTPGVGGSLSSTAAGNCVTLFCGDDGLTWTVAASEGTFTYV